MKTTRTTPTVLMANGSISGAIDLHAAIEFSRDGQLRTPKFSISAYTGVALQNVVRGQRLPIVVDLAGLESPRAAIPVLKDHNPSLIVGHTDRIVNDGRQLSVTGVASGAGSVSQEVVQSAKDGFPWQASITASVLEQEEIPRGRKVMVNGREFTGPIVVARRARLKEVSFVALGADDNTSAAIAAKESTMTFEQWLKAKGWSSVTDLTQTQEATLRAQFAREQEDLQASGGEGEEDPADLEQGAGAPTTTRKKKPARKPAGRKPASGRAASTVRASGSSDGAGDAGADGGADADLDRDLQAAAGAVDAGGDDDAAAPITMEDLRAAQQAERTRIAAINRRCQNEEIRATAIARGWTPERAELEELRASRAGAPAAHIRDHDSAQNAQVLEAALCRSSGMRGEFLEQHFDERTLEAAEHGDLRNLSIQGLFHQVIRAACLHAPMGAFGNDHIRAGFKAEEIMIRASGNSFSTVSLSGILGNVANKSMLQAFLAVETVAERICRVRSVRDFKQHTSYRMTMRGTFEKVGPAGELKHLRLSEEDFTNQAHTYGALVGLTRQMIINDDLGAFQDLPRMLGRKAALTREQLVFELLLSNPSNFFHADNDNYIEGSGTPLAIAGLTQLEQKFMDQTDEDGQPVLVSPKILLVPTALKVTAQQLMTETRVNESATAGSPKPANNPHAGKWTPLASPYLNAQGLSGQSSTAYYLFADPQDVAAMEIAYLNGQSTPVIESGEASFNTLGMQWRSFFDFGVAMQDHRGAAKSKGSA